MKFSEIPKYVAERIQVPIIEAAKLVLHARLKTFDAGELIFSQGESGKNLYLVLSGIAYVYYQHAEGHEKMKRFVSSKDSLAPYISLLTGEPSNYSARALKACACLEIRYADYMALVSKSWALETSLRRELELQIMEREKKEYELFMLSAEERYDSFVIRHAEILNHIPLKLIASYINVDPATLSRIRLKKGLN